MIYIDGDAYTFDPVSGEWLELHHTHGYEDGAS